MLVLAAVMALPALLPLARFFFESFEAFHREAGVEHDVERTGWMPGPPRRRAEVPASIVSFTGCYALLVVALYQGAVWIAQLFA